jgi:hypothetical protein
MKYGPAAAAAATTEIKTEMKTEGGFHNQGDNVKKQ